MQTPTPPCEHTCWMRPMPMDTFDRHVADVSTEATCPAHQWLAGYAAGKQSQCAHHRAFSLEEGQPLLCPTCGATVQEPPHA